MEQPLPTHLEIATALKIGRKAQARIGTRYGETRRVGKHAAKAWEVKVCKQVNVERLRILCSPRD